MAQTDNVTFEHPEYQAHIHQVRLVNDVYNGIDTIQKHLRKVPNENTEDFATRQVNSELENMVERITTTMAGMIFRKPLSFEDVQDKDIEAFKTIAGAESLEQFMKRSTNNAIRDGKSFIMVDMPVDGGDPYFTNILRENLINWRKDDTGALIFAVIKESYIAEAGEFEIQTATQYREIQENGNIRIWRGNNNVWSVAEEINTSYNFCPIYEIDIDDTPPLYDIAKTNIGYYNRQSLKEHYLDYCASPYLLTIGLGIDAKNPLTLGINSSINTDNPDGDVKWIELEGKNIEALQDDLERKAKSMLERAIKLMSESKQTKTATQTATENSESSSRLTDIANDTENTTNTAYNAWSQMKRSKDADGEIMVNKDFNLVAPDMNLINGLNAMVVSGNLSRETMLKALIKAEIVDIENIEDELKTIDSEFVEEEEINNDLPTGTDTGD